MGSGRDERAKAFRDDFRGRKQLDGKKGVSFDAFSSVEHGCSG
jgi:hypothetical protein